MFPFAILPIVLGKHVFFELEHKIPGLKKIDSALMHTGSLATFSLTSKNLRSFCLKTLTQYSRLKTLTKYFHQKSSPNSHPKLSPNSHPKLSPNSHPKLSPNSHSHFKITYIVNMYLFLLVFRRGTI